MDIAIIGAGTVGTAVAVLWTRAGHRITAVSGRQATKDRVARWLPRVPVLDAVSAAATASVTVLAVPDDALGAVAAQIAPSVRPDDAVVHMSGAASVHAIDPAGGRSLAVHPLQTFADVAGAVATLPGCTVAVTATDDAGWPLGEQLARDLGAAPFRLTDDMRPLYHAAAVFASNYLVATSGAAAELFAAAGVPDPASAMLPLQRATLDNIDSLGPRAALTGPAVRGDAGTIARNLTAVAVVSPSLVPAYVAMCDVALDVAGPRLPADRRAAVEEVLAPWR
jgi:predicted short-subunit dehydrogenase-like oxidoreductase (DUF2520 family)